MKNFEGRRLLSLLLGIFGICRSGQTELNIIKHHHCFYLQIQIKAQWREITSDRQLTVWLVIVAVVLQTWQPQVQLRGKLRRERRQEMNECILNHFELILSDVLLIFAYLWFACRLTSNAAAHELPVNQLSTNQLCWWGGFINKPSTGQLVLLTPHQLLFILTINTFAFFFDCYRSFSATSTTQTVKD